MTRYVIKEDGTIEERKARPQRLPDELARLPSELVTPKEIEPEDKIHPLDPPHIREALVEEHQKKITAKEPEDPNRKIKNLPGGPLAVPGERKRLNQRDIDYVRIRIMSVLLGNIEKCRELRLDPDFSVKHVWFPEDEVNYYELRPGKPPSHFDRPKHMRGFRLWVDPRMPDQSMIDLAAEVGVDISFTLVKQSYAERLQLVGGLN